MAAWYLGLAAASMAMVTTPQTAQAATQNSNMGVSMTITASCTVTAGTLAFGPQSSLQSNVDQQGTFSVTCTNTTPYTVALDAGANGASVTTRRMKGGVSNTEFVNYALFLNNTRSTNWGTTTGTDTLGGTGNGSAQTLTVYGRIPPQTLASPGSYNDSVVITVTY